MCHVSLSCHVYAQKKIMQPNKQQTYSIIHNLNKILIRNKIIVLFRNIACYSETYIENKIPTLYNFSLLYQMSSSSCSEFGTGASRCKSSLDRDKIFRRDTISPLLGPQLKFKKIIFIDLDKKN